MAAHSQEGAWDFISTARLIVYCLQRYCDWVTLRGAHLGAVLAAVLGDTSISVVRLVSIPLPEHATRCGSDIVVGFAAEFRVGASLEVGLEESCEE